jgi:hypothetical protein
MRNKLQRGCTVGVFTGTIGFPIALLKVIGNSQPMHAAKMTGNTQYVHANADFCVKASTVVLPWRMSKPQ